MKSVAIICSIALIAIALYLAATSLWRSELERHTNLDSGVAQFYLNGIPWESQSPKKTDSSALSGNYSPFIRESETLFISLDALGDMMKIEDKLLKDDCLTTFIKAAAIYGDNSRMPDFYNPEAIILNLPVLKVGGRAYLDSEYLKDFYGLVVLDLKPHVAVFREPSSAIGKGVPDMAGVLPKGTSIYFDELGSKGISTLAESVEVYYSLADYSANKDEKESDVLVYGKGFGKAFVDIKYIENSSAISNKGLIDSGVKPTKKKYKKILMSWDVLESYSHSINAAPTQKHKGLDVLIPTTFTPKGMQVKFALSREYVKKAHDLAYELYASFSNGGDIDWTKRFLKSYSAKEAAIDSIVLMADYSRFSGINVYFTGLDAEFKTDFSEFCADLGRKLHGVNTKLSVNVELKTNISEVDFNGGETSFEDYIDFSKLNPSVDYFVLMAIKGLNTDLKKPQAIAKPDFAEGILREFAGIVPSEMLVLAQPAYALSFCLENGGKGTYAEYSLPLNRLSDVTKGLLIDKYFDDMEQQVYVEYRNPEKSASCFVWHDDEKSLLSKLSLIDKYDLAGFAYLQRGFEPKWFLNSLEQYFSDH